MSFPPPGTMAPSSKSPCGACKFLRRKCTQECVFAPYFPPEDTNRFAMVHKIFGASTVAKLLNALPAQHRDDAVRSLVYEAIFRHIDPVKGCTGYITKLEEQISQLKNENQLLSAYVGPAAFSAFPYNAGGGGGGGEVGGGTPFGIPTTHVAWPQTQMLHNQHIAAAISNNDQQEISNLMFSMDGGGGGAGSSVMTGVDGRYNPMSMMGGMPSSSYNPFGAQPAESDHQNPQVSPADAGASSVHHHYLSLEQQQQLYLQQQLGQVSPAVHHHHLSLQQQQQLCLQQGQVSPAVAGHHHLSLQQQQQLLHLQQQEGQEPALHLREAGDDKDSAGPSC